MHYFWLVLLLSAEFMLYFCICIIHRMFLHVNFCNYTTLTVKEGLLWNAAVSVCPIWAHVSEGKGVET